MPIAIGAILGAWAVSLPPGSGDDGHEPDVAMSPPNLVRLPEPDDVESSGTSEPASVAIDELAAIADPAVRRASALALLDDHGNSAVRVDEIAATLPLMEADIFRIDAIVTLAGQDTQGALAAAMLLPYPEQRRLALRRLAQALAETDPPGAISNLDAIDSATLQSDFIVEFLEAWALVDPDRALAWLATSGDARIPLTESAFALLADHDPERLLDASDRFPPDAHGEAFTAALRSLIQQDAVAALALIDQLPAGPDQSTLEFDVARGYGEQDPDGAWRWANEMDATADRRLVVLAGIQSVDPDRALELMMMELDSGDAGRRAEMRQRVGSFLGFLHQTAQSRDVERALDRLLATDSSLEPNVQQFLSTTWANDDPESALAWSLQNIDRIQSDQVLVNIGRNLAQADIEQARRALYQLPSDRQASWVSGVGRTLADSDLDAAREWALQFPSGSLRDAALHEYVRSEAHGGTVDEQLFDQFSSDNVRGQAASEVASRLACSGQAVWAAEIAVTHIAREDLLTMTERQIERNALGGPNSIFCRLNP